MDSSLHSMGQQVTTYQLAQELTRAHIAIILQIHKTAKLAASHNRAIDAIQQAAW